MASGRFPYVAVYRNFDVLTRRVTEEVHKCINQVDFIFPLEDSQRLSGLRGLQQEERKERLRRRI